MSLQETERRRRQSERDGTNHNDHRVLSFRQWCELNGISPATGRRLIGSGVGPVITQLSPRRIGITVANNARWIESRSRTGGDVG
jgi:hypothetical protein